MQLWEIVVINCEDIKVAIGNASNMNEKKASEHVKILLGLSHMKPKS
jgi:hypothetical protein